MRRQTRRDSTGKAFFKPADPDCGSCRNCDRLAGCMGRWAEALAACEDTGLEPEEVTAMCEMDKRVDRVRITRLEDWLGISADRLCKLAEAEKEGRCVVLPEKLLEHAKQTSVERDCITNIRKPRGDFLVKPCPFCGSKNIVYWQYRHAAGLRWRIACTHCLAMIDPGWVQEYGYLAELWNTRAEAEAALEAKT